MGRKLIDREKAGDYLPVGRFFVTSTYVTVNSFMVFQTWKLTGHLLSKLVVHLIINALLPPKQNWPTVLINKSESESCMGK